MAPMLIALSGRRHAFSVSGAMKEVRGYTIPEPAACDDEGAVGIRVSAKLLLCVGMMCVGARWWAPSGMSKTVVHKCLALRWYGWCWG